MYESDELPSFFGKNRTRLANVAFKNVGFSNTRVRGFEFSRCRFEDGLFLSTVFEDCRFIQCEFINCNFSRAEFDSVFIDPKCFIRATPKNGYENIGVYLFQQLLRNSKREGQPDFTDESQFWFRHWLMRQHLSEIRMLPLSCNKVLKIARLAFLGFYQISMGSGMRVGRLFVTIGITVIVLSIFNLFALESIKSSSGPLNGFVDALYFTTVVLTTLGFGDFVPMNSNDRLIVSFEALLGYLILAILASTIYRKIAD